METLLRVGVTATTAISIWSIVHFGGYALIDDAVSAPEGSPIFLLLLPLSIPAGLALLARHRYRRRGSLPSNVEDLPDGARRRDFYMEQDPDSIREPGAAQRYAAPDGGS